MTIQEVIDHIISTPGNSNPNVLRGMLEQLSGGESVKMYKHYIRYTLNQDPMVADLLITVTSKSSELVTNQDDLNNILVSAIAVSAGGTAAETGIVTYDLTNVYTDNGDVYLWAYLRESNQFMSETLTYFSGGTSGTFTDTVVEI